MEDDFHSYHGEFRHGTFGEAIAESTFNRWNVLLGNPPSHDMLFEHQIGFHFVFEWFKAADDVGILPGTARLFSMPVIEINRLCG